jgi:hypothetical protein
MAKTYTYGDVLSLISSQIPKVTEDDKAVFISNLALNKIWNRHDWPESLAPLPPFALTPGEQDHGAPAAAIPSDFGGLRKANFVELSSAPAKRWPPLRIIRDLVYTEAEGYPEAISWEPSVSAFRVYPRVPQNITAPLYQIDGTYKIRPEKITASAIHSTTLPFDDQYLHVFLEWAKWAAWTLTSSPQAGGVVYANRQKTYTGQLAHAVDAVDSMANDAGLILGDAVIHPDPDTWFPTSW